jgi:transposase
MMAMGNYLKMPDKRRVLTLLEMGWSYRRIERETGVRRETVARYDPKRQSNAANLSSGFESTIDEPGDDEANAANLSAGSSHAHGPPGVAEPYRKQIEAGLRQGLTAQRIYQDLCDQEAYPHKYASVRRYVRRLKQQHPKLVDVMEHPPGEERRLISFRDRQPSTRRRAGGGGRGSSA